MSEIDETMLWIDGPKAEFHNAITDAMSRYEGQLSGVEMIAITSYIVGQMSAVLEGMSVEEVLEIILMNVQIGNQQMIDELHDKFDDVQGTA